MKALSGLCAICVLSGCGRPPESNNQTVYKLVASKSGTVYRINGGSGEVDVINGSESRRVVDWKEALTNNVRRWVVPVGSLQGVTAVIVAKQDGEKAWVRLTIAPAWGYFDPSTTMKFDEDMRNVTVEFYDGDGFELWGISERVRAAYISTNSSGTKEAQFFRNADCKQRDFEATAKCAVTYSFK